MDEECCNGIGFDPKRHVCADQATAGLLIPHQCFQGAVCPMAAAATAYCGSCDLDPSLTACTWVLTAHPHSDTEVPTELPFISTTLKSLTTVLPAHTNRSKNNNKIADRNGQTNTENTEKGRNLCLSHEEVVYSGDANVHTYTAA
ncbi:hypothetical protein CHARACLAT_014451 [Characodon lateralis]|uniref:Uncharacterized protein n=1 Tax=Characodon lateralis TaxID=208331 RepID=A0ABU7E4L1_9TELE|nr:hypothetical protein [Characodon lateralis]